MATSAERMRALRERRRRRLRRLTIDVSENEEETRFIVPADRKKSSLETLGITESSLFPEIDKAAARIKDRYSKP